MTDLSAPTKKYWFQYLNGYHWIVLALGTFGWLFDCMDQRLFILARSPAMKELLSEGATGDTIRTYGAAATAAMIAGWATGGLIFGILSDRLGRVKTLIITLFLYSGFSCLSALSVSWWDFMLYRFLFGMGVGGQFAAAATLVAESLPDRARAQALGCLQALSAVGNITGSYICLYIPPDMEVWGISGWRVVFFIGVLPALLAVFMLTHLREPEKWIEARNAAKSGKTKQMGSIKDLLSHPRWLKHTIVGVTLAVAGVVGLWGIGFFSPELIDYALKDLPTEEVAYVKAKGTMLQDVGACFGMYAFMLLALFLGRRTAFFISLLMGMICVSFVFYSLETASDAYWMLPMMGFSTLMIFGGYAIYFPELYPTRLRNTGVGFCYNVGRYLTVPFPWMTMMVSGFFTTAFLEGGMLSSFYGFFGIDSGFRAGAITMTSIYFLGMIALVFAPETRNQPLPEE